MNAPGGKASVTGNVKKYYTDCCSMRLSVSHVFYRPHNSRGHDFGLRVFVGYKTTKKTKNLLLCERMIEAKRLE